MFSCFLSSLFLFLFHILYVCVFVVVFFFGFICLVLLLALVWAFVCSFVCLLVFNCCCCCLLTFVFAVSLGFCMSVCFHLFSSCPFLFFFFSPFSAELCGLQCLGS